MMKTSRLKITPARLDNISRRRRFGGQVMDYLINEKFLAGLLALGDYCCPLGGFDHDREKHFALMLLRKTPSDLPSGRVPLYICCECGDYGCGVVSCEVERAGDQVLWRHFGVETDLDDSLSIEEEWRGIGRGFAFDAQEYSDVLRKYVNL